MNRGTVAALVIGCAAVGSVPALATPAGVDTGRMAEVSVTVPLSRGDVLALDIRGAEMSAGPELLIEAQECTPDGECVTQDDYSSPLPDGALSIDPSNAVARLHTTLGGRDLVISWQPSNGAVVGAGYLDGGGSSAATSNFAGDAADATVQFDGATCTASGGVGQGVAGTADLGDGSATAPVSELNLPADASLHCGS